MTANQLSPRSQRGLELAKAKHQLLLRINNDVWIVPSATCPLHAYVVNVARVSCTCSDFKASGSMCKHIWCVAYLQNEVTLLDGTRLAPPPIVDGDEWRVALELEGASS